MAEKQCRICLDGVEEEPELGRLIRPCLCKGSISYVHVQCLHRWRNTSPSQSAFFSCPQCHYKYRFARTRVIGIATNPVIVGAISSLLFVAITFVSSSVTSYLMSIFQGSSSTYYYSSFFPVSPIDVAYELVNAVVPILQDEDLDGMADNILAKITRSQPSPIQGAPHPPLVNSGSHWFKSLFVRFFMGLPLVGAASLVHMLLSLPLLGPIHWIARFRRGRRRNSRDISVFIIMFLLVIGAARALYKVYQFTQNVTKRLLMRAEESILEVNS